MNLPVYSLENKKIIYFFLAIMLIGGIYSFFKLPKKEDSPFVIKQAVLVTQYPGATPQEVEKLITEPIEREIQSMSDVFQIKSESYFGMSKISIELQPTLAPDYMPVKWDELRRKVANIQPRLPSGASAINVSDDFGDVFGIYYALTADEGFTYDDMRDWAQKIKTECAEGLSVCGTDAGRECAYLGSQAGELGDRSEFDSASPANPEPAGQYG